MCPGHSYEPYSVKFFWSWHHFNISDMETETWNSYNELFFFFFLKGFYFCGELCSTNVYLDEDTWGIETRLGSGEKWNHI